MDGMGLGLLGVRAARIEAESTRPWAPAVPDRETGRRHTRGVAAARPGWAARPRRVLSGALHQVADVVAPSTDRLCDPAR